MPVCNFEDLSDHESLNCNYPKGGISAIAVIKAAAVGIDWTDTVALDAAILAGDIKIVKPIKAELPEPSLVEGENVTACGAETILDGFDYTLPYKDFNVDTFASGTANDTFYLKLNNSSFSGIAMYMCDTNELRIVDKGVNFSASLVIPSSNKEKQYYNVVAKWSSSVNDPFPAVSDVATGYFE
jgi:hypothetical protein